MSDITAGSVSSGGYSRMYARLSVTAQPVSVVDRIVTIDTLRGFALLGILVMNIDDFAIPGAFGGIPLNAFTGDHATLNMIIWAIKWIFFEGRMRGVFAMLFGAGVVLLTERISKRDGVTSASDIYMRRNMWLLVMGFLHGVFIWTGDILFHYGLCALIFLYPFRLLKSRTLIITGTLVSLFIATTSMSLFYLKLPQRLALQQQVAAEVSHTSGAHPDAEAVKRAKEWKELNTSQVTDKEGYAEQVAEVREQSYVEGVEARFTRLYGDRSGRGYLEIFDEFSAMLIGMGLFKNGFLTGRQSTKVYAWTVAIGFLISVPLSLLGLWHVQQDGFTTWSMSLWLYLPYYLNREAASLAITALILLLMRQGVAKGLWNALSAVGRTALSNYLLTSLIARALFSVGPWALYGRLEYYQITYVIAAIWAFNIVASMLWLRAFRFGPIEWAWRSLTYAQWQPMRIREPVTA